MKASAAAGTTLALAALLTGGMLGGAALGASAATGPAPAAAPTTGLHYVALGDSYSAGFGLIPYSDTPAPGCYQALANYPHLVAAALGLDLDDRTCSGAVTANIRNTPQPTITSQGTAPVQSDALGPDTDIVTVTIGGNDLGFADISAFCVANSATGPLLSDLYDNCKQYYAPTVDGITLDQLAYKIDNTVAPALDETFALIAQKAPNAKVFVVGYPALTPDFANVPAGGCFTPALSESPPYPQNSFPFTDIDTAYLHGTEVKLDDAIQTAAEENGATYLSTLPGTNSHSACAAAADAFINGISLITPSEGQGTPTGLPGLLVKLGALHPNAAGVAYLANTVQSAITDAVGESPEPTPTPTPTATPSPEPTAVPSPKPTSSAAAPVPSTTAAPPGSAARAGSPSTLAATGLDAAPLGALALCALVAGAAALAVVGVASLNRRRARG